MNSLLQSIKIIFNGKARVQPIRHRQHVHKEGEAFKPGRPTGDEASLYQDRQSGDSSPGAGAQSPPAVSPPQERVNNQQL